MWIRANLKANAKVAFKRNYWKCVLAAIILGIVTGAGSGAVSSVTGNSTSQTTESIIGGEFYEDDLYADDIYADDLLDNATSILSGISGTFATTVLVGIILVVLVFALALQFFLFGPLEVGCANFFKTNAYEKAELNQLTVSFQKEHYIKMSVTMFLRNLYTALWMLLLIVPGVIKAYEYRMIPYILTDCPDISRKDAFRISKEMMRGNKMDAFILDLSFFGWSILAAITCGIAGVFYVSPYVAATDAELFIAIREEYFKGQREAAHENNTDNSWEN